jgi:hypothetical protein
MTQTLSTRTVCCKLSLDENAATAIRATAVQFNAAATSCASVAWHERITNKNTLHYIVYGPTRVNYGLGSQLACCARDKAAEAVRAARANGSDTCPTFRPDSSIRYDARTYRLMRMDRVSHAPAAHRPSRCRSLPLSAHRPGAGAACPVSGCDKYHRLLLLFLALTAMSVLHGRRTAPPLSPGVGA